MPSDHLVTRLRLLSELEFSGGMIVAASDDEISYAQRLLATDAGVVAEITSAATLAGLISLAGSESLAGQSAVLVVTGGRVDD